MLDGMYVTLESETGEELDRVSHVQRLWNVLPDLSEDSFTLLRFSDPYGNTIFNQLQLRDFLQEWTRLFERASDQEQKEILSGIQQLAQRSLERHNTYVKFYGD